jgi:hypothetical protein
MALERDRIDQWKVNEKRNVIENISVLFKTAERNLENIIKKNKSFTHTDIMKGRVFSDLTTPFENHFKYLIDEGNNVVNSVTSLTEKYMLLKDRALKIDVEATKKLDTFSSSLDLKLRDRDKNLSAFEEEKAKMISEIKVLQESIEDYYLKIKNIIKSKNGNCLQEAKDLISWSLVDNESELFSRPIVWIYMPLYVMFIENEETSEERMVAVYPGFITDDPNNRYQEISGAMLNLKEAVYERIEEDMALRSNFEFSSENRNLLNDQSLSKKIQQGISILRKSAVLNEQMERELRSKLDLLFTQ